MREDVAPPSLDMTPRAEPLWAVPRAELPCVEVPFSPFIDQRLAELSVNLWGEVDGHETCFSGDHGLQKGKLLPKPKARMDAYRVGRNVFSFVALSVDVPLRVRELKEHDSQFTFVNHTEVRAVC